MMQCNASTSNLNIFNRGTNTLLLNWAKAPRRKLNILVRERVRGDRMSLLTCKAHRAEERISKWLRVPIKLTYTAK